MTTAQLPPTLPSIPEAIPLNNLVGVVDGRAALDAIRADLRALGLASSLLFRASRPDPVADSGIADWFLESLENILSEENEYRDQYQAAADAGSYVLAVPLADSDSLANLQGLLERHGAHTIRHFGTFSVTSL